MKFLILAFDLPRKKAYARVKIWRKLQRLGAQLKYRSHWVLPSNKENLIEFKKICEEIKKFGGRAEIIEGEKVG